MQLKVIGTGSQGNCYLLYNENECLIIECGVRFMDIKKALDFDLSKVVGCILTHEHQDHAKSVREMIEAGIEVYASQGTFEALNIAANNRMKPLHEVHEFFVGNFQIKRFDVKHDAADPSGFLIRHPECGKVLFLTDTFYCPYTFKGLNNLIIEANYHAPIAKQRLGEMEFLRNRIMQSHMSLETCISTVQANDLSKVNNILLIHLSDTNSDERLFKKEVESATGCKVTVASNGMELNFNKNPF